MSASTPQELPWLLLDALNAADVPGVVALYEPHGVALSGDGCVAAGHEAIGRVITYLVKRQPQFSLREADVTMAGELALIRSAWAVETPRPGGGMDEVQLDTVLVVRRQDDGRWLVAIDRSERQDAARSGQRDTG